MLTFSPILAALEPPDLEALKNAHPATNRQFFGTDITIILGVLLALTVLLLLWAFFLRKKPTYARGSLVVQRSDKKGRSSHPSSGRKRRRRRSDSAETWGRNPTLSETGGLPPPRPEGPETPAAPE